MSFQKSVKKEMLQKIRLKPVKLQDKAMKTCKNAMQKWRNPQKMKNAEKELANTGDLRYNNTIKERGTPLSMDMKDEKEKLS